MSKPHGATALRTLATDWFTAAGNWWQRWYGDSHTALGRRGERAAVRYLKARGYRIVARGRRAGFVEIDIVAVDGRTVVFVEVKTRRSDQAGEPAEAVDPQRQQRMTRAALAFLKFHDLMECAARFDVVAVHWPEGSRRPEIQHIENAFEAAGVDGMFS
ncbi:MAG: YraN family protein [Pirellulales bacterium]